MKPYSFVQKSLLYKKSYRIYLIPILLFICSFVLYSYSLEDQSRHVDEIVYISWGGPYFELITEGDFDNPCLKGLANCELLYDPNWAGHNVNYSPLRNFFVGFGYFLTTGAIEGNFYNWSCVFFSCFDQEIGGPTSEEFSAGRFFSPIFGSLTIVLAFFIGKMLFNRTTGLFFSVILLFSGLWFLNSRLMMSEVYLYFFIFLSVLFLLKSFKKEGKYKIPYFIFGAISFGLALNIKLIAIEFAIPFLGIILFYDSFNEKLNFGFFKKKKNVIKAISLIVVFFVISSMIFVVTVPKYHDDTFNKILKTSTETEIGFASFPTAEKNYVFQTLITLQVTLLPYLMDSFIHDVFADEVGKIRLGDPSVEPTGSPSNYATIPLSLFFFIGLIYLIRKIKTRNLIFSEFTLLVLFTSLFIFSILVVDDPTIERYYLPLMFSVMLIAVYGLGNFIKQIQGQKEKIVFFTSFMIAHSLYIITLVDEMYFPSPFLINPLPVSSQLSLNDPLVYVSSIMFVMIFVLILLRIKTTIPVETRQSISKNKL